MRPLWFLPVVCLATAEPVFAQIYAWRDDAGRLVLSNKPRADAIETVAGTAPGRAVAGTTKPPFRSESQTKYDDLIEYHAAAHGVSAGLVRAVIQAESGFNPYAVSEKGAMGLMQLMPVTARALDVRDPFDPRENIRGGVSYLARLLERYQNLELALAAYNAGPSSVDRHGDVPPYRETQDYVSKVTAATTAWIGSREGSVVYRSVEIVNGEPRRRYSNIPPRDSAYEIVGRR